MKKKILSLLVAFIAVGALSGCGKPPAGGSPGDKETEKCGNEKLDAGEKCDKKIAAGEPGACPTAETCQDDEKELSGEADKCTAECVAPKCGNKKLDAGETCDIKGEGDEKCLRRAACEAKAGSDGNHKWVYSGKYSDCTAKCEEVEADCNDTAKDGFCPEKCTSATDADCVDYAGECESDSECKEATFAGKTVPGVCFRSFANDAPKGRCTYSIDATTSSVCATAPVGSVGVATSATSGVCAFICSDDTACGGEGWTCTAKLKNGTKICQYAPRYPLKDIGKACSSAAQCDNGSGLCFDTSGETYNFGQDQGFCYVPCSKDTLLCPEGSKCLPVTKTQGFCVKSCIDNFGCDRGKGAAADYYCAPTSGSSGVCLPYDGKKCADITECDAAKHETCVAMYKDAPQHKVCAIIGKSDGSGKNIGAACKGVWECNNGLDASCTTMGKSGAAKICSADCSDDSGFTCPASTQCYHYQASVTLPNGDTADNVPFARCVVECTASGNECDTLAGTECGDIGNGKMGCLPTSP